MMGFVALFLLAIPAPWHEWLPVDRRTSVLSAAWAPIGVAAIPWVAAGAVAATEQSVWPHVPVVLAGLAMAGSFRSFALTVAADGRGTVSGPRTLGSRRWAAALAIVPSALVAAVQGNVALQLLAALLLSAPAFLGIRPFLGDTSPGRWDRAISPARAIRSPLPIPRSIWRDACLGFVQSALWMAPLAVSALWWVVPPTAVGPAGSGSRASLRTGGSASNQTMVG